MHQVYFGFLFHFQLLGKFDFTLSAVCEKEKYKIFMAINVFYSSQI